ncbi:DUF4432 family protein [Nakamurella sp. YIM 132087]|uniref:DUF4432 family protein n=1 Tax=Nakamurella alba TaxID=2665158 RepID=A0A7K1FPX7_9ACTN|nr:aldose 1-epimerase family protein [Nakamurella alba]MTD16205.1 DUF4432 family protein [Nakamurella alba]
MLLHGQDLDRRELRRRAGSTAAAGGVRAVVLDDGSERGVRVLEFRTAAGLRFEVLIDRAFDIGAAEFDGCSIGWQSPTGVVDPRFADTDDDALMPLRGMNGLLVTGGLDHIMSAQTVDASQYRYPARPTVRHPIHGRIARIPARLIGYGQDWTDTGCVLWAEAEIVQAAVFGEHLVLHRRYEVDLDGSDIRMTDRVVNRGFDPTPHMFLYHVNVGWPLVDEGSRLDAAVARTLWETDSVREQGLDHRVLSAPVPGALEQVYEHELRPDADGRVRAGIVNDRLGLSFHVDVDPAQLPCFFQWLHLREGAYAVGLEPATHHAAGDQAARDDGAMIWLGDGEERRYSTVLRFGHG